MATTSTVLSEPDTLQRTSSDGSVTARISERSPVFSNGPRLSMRHSTIPALPTNEPLELLTLTNEAICNRDALLACKRLSRLCKESSITIIREQLAHCLARALLLFGDVFPYTARFPPMDEFMAALGPEEHVIVAVLARDNKKSEILSAMQDEVVDGLESYPVTFYRAQPATPLTKEFHAEAIMLCDVEKGETLYLIDNRSTFGVGSTVSATMAGLNRRATGRLSTYFAKRLYKDVVVVVMFPRTIKESADPIVTRFLDRLTRLFEF